MKERKELYPVIRSVVEAVAGFVTVPKDTSIRNAELQGIRDGIVVLITFIGHLDPVLLGSTLIGSRLVTHITTYVPRFRID